MTQIPHLRKFSSSVLLATVLLTLPCRSDMREDVTRILENATAPAGVVFEVVSGDLYFLAQSMPKIREHSKQLRDRFADLDIAVVTHGVEEFSLTRERRKDFPELHASVRTLTSEEDIPVHVCGTHASWQDLTAEAFPEYVDVAPVGPAQVRTYQELGYELVLVRPGDL